MANLVDVYLANEYKDYVIVRNCEFKTVGVLGIFLEPGEALVAEKGVVNTLLGMTPLDIKVTQYSNQKDETIKKKLMLKSTTDNDDEPFYTMREDPEWRINNR